MSDSQINVHSIQFQTETVPEANFIDKELQSNLMEKKHHMTTEHHPNALL